MSATDSCPADASSALSRHTRRTKIRSLGRRKMTRLARKTIAEALTSPRSDLRNRVDLGLNLDAFGRKKTRYGKRRQKSGKRRTRRTRSHSHVLEESAPRRTSRLKDALLTNQGYRASLAPPRFAITNWNPLQEINKTGKTRMRGPRGGMQYRVPESVDRHIDHPPASSSPKGDHFNPFF